MTGHNPTPCETLEMQNRAVEVQPENPPGAFLFFKGGTRYDFPPYEAQRNAERLHEHNRVVNNLPQENGKPDDYSVMEQARTERILAYMMVFFFACILTACIIFGGVMANRADQRRQADQKAAERAMEPVSVPQLGVPQ